MEPSLEKIAAGSQEALQNLFAQKGYSVYKFASDRTGDREIAKRVTKEVFSGLPSLLSRKENGGLSTPSLDRLLIARTKELCDSFQDLADIRGELFGRTAPSSPEQDSSLQGESFPPASSPSRPVSARAPSPAAEKTRASFSEDFPDSALPKEPEKDAPVSSGSGAPSAEPTLLTGLISPVVIPKEPKHSFEDVSSAAASREESRTSPVSPALYEIPSPSRKPLSPLYDESGFPEEPEEEELYDEKEGSGKSFLFGFFLFLLIVCILILGWAIIGILMDIGWLPYLDLGYGWFNETVYPLF